MTGTPASGSPSPETGRSTAAPPPVHPVEVLGKPLLTGVRILFRPGIRKAATLVLMGAACHAPVKLLPDSGGKLRYVVGAR